MMYKTYRYNDMPVPMSGRSGARRQAAGQRSGAAKEPKEKSAEDVQHDKHIEKKKDAEQKGFLDNIETDDLILIAVALVLLMDGCDDKLLLLAIAYIFCVGQSEE